LAPIKDDVQNVLDIATGKRATSSSLAQSNFAKIGTGIWAIEFG
jgi:hypothetical protein